MSPPFLDFEKNLRLTNIRFLNFIRIRNKMFGTLSPKKEFTRGYSHGVSSFTQWWSTEHGPIASLVSAGWIQVVGSVHNLAHPPKMTKLG
jgi:hypothetical protein